MPPVIDSLFFRKILLDWYRQYQRALPWRTTKDPYKIWLSEIILQQTRVAQGLPYYERFIAHYPSVTSLASATEQEILRLWQGLGYYSRARNIHHCAQTIVRQYNGLFPSSYRTLLTLKGIGPYTAAAIAAIAFKEVVAAVDGNVYRVLARIFGLTDDIGTSQGRKQITRLATELVDPLAPDSYSQAIMDFGALQCTPRLPRCTSCVFQSYCRAFHTHNQLIFPIKTHRIVKKKRFFNYIIIQYQGTIYMRKRAGRDIWNNMYDFHLVEHTKHALGLDEIEDPLLSLAAQHHLSIVALEQGKQHLLTHQTLLINFYLVQATLAFLQEGVMLFNALALEPFSSGVIDALPKPKVIQHILQEFRLV